MKIYDEIIIGAGPTGLFCAINSHSEKNREILLLEKNLSPGKKFLLSGSGQCNITHTGTVSDFVHHYGSAGSFVKPALKAFTPEGLVDFLECNGIRTTARDDGKVFPASMRGSDVLDMMLSLCLAGGIEIRYSASVERVINREGLFEVHSASGVFFSKVLVIAAGGASYPSTGSTGDGYRIASGLGHKITETTTALTPVYIRSYLFGELSGISLKNRKISLYKNGKKTVSSQGDILFTRSGLSGPGILDISRYVEAGDILEISFVLESAEYINNFFVSSSRLSGGTNLKNVMKGFSLPERLITLLLENEGIDPKKNVSEMSRIERGKVTAMLSEYPFIVDAKGGYNVAMATSGGVSREQIDSRTMESRLVRGLFFAGEVIDVDGDTGGYNLQWAFSSGKAAAMSILSRCI